MDLIVLVVEDEPGVLEVIVQFLQLGGFRVIKAMNGPEALRVAGQHAGHIDMLLTDVEMPGMSGHELAERLRGQRPLMKVLFMTGYTRNDVLLRNFRDAEVPFLQKPFSSSELASKIRELLTSDDSP